MTTAIKYLASTRLTLVGFGTLGLVLIAKEFSVFSAPFMVLAILAGLTLNLAAAATSLAAASTPDRRSA